MSEEQIEKVMQDVNQWSVEDLRELADNCNNLADSIEADEKEKSEV